MSRGNNLALVFPPGWTPVAPYLALPQIKGYLNVAGLDADIYDDNVVFFDTILSSEYVLPMCSKLISKMDIEDSHGLKKDGHLQWREGTVRLFAQKFTRLNEFKALLRRGGAHFDRSVYAQVLSVITAALDVASLAYDQTISFSDITYNSYDRDSLIDIPKLLCDEKKNIFVSYYRSIRASFVKQLSEHNIVGISITSIAQLVPALTLCRAIRDFNSNIIIFLGGNYVTRLAVRHMKKASFLFDYIDFVSCYEGECLLASIVKSRCYSRRDVLNIVKKFGNCAIQESDKVIKLIPGNSFSAKQVSCPNFDGFPFEKYFSPVLILPISSSKGCYSNCAFCTIPSATSCKGYQVLELNSVIDRMELLSYKYKTKCFSFVDETFSIGRMIEFSKILAERKDEFYWTAETRFDRKLSTEEGRILSRAGCLKLQFGLESYNQRILDLMNKKVRKSDILPVIESCLLNRIAVHLFYIVGFPSETKKEAAETISFVNKILRMSVEKYGITESTSGASAFGLEVGSCVYQHPQTYGITIQPHKKDYIGLSCAYKVKSGISSTEANKTIHKLLQDEAPLFSVDFSSNLFEEIAVHFALHRQNQLANRLCDKEVGIVRLQGLNRTVYYSYSGNFGVPLESSPEKLTSQELALLDAYGLELSQACRIGALEYYVNPYLKFSTNNCDYIIEDTILGERMVVDRFLFELLRLLREVKDDVAQYIRQSGLFSETGAVRFMEEMKKQRFLIAFSRADMIQ